MLSYRTPTNARADSQMDRERARERQLQDRRSHDSPRLRRPSPTYEYLPARPRSPPPPRPEKEPTPEDPVEQLMNEVDAESRSVFVSQIASRMTSQDLGMFIEDRLGRGSVRDARVIMDKGAKRSKGSALVSLLLPLKLTSSIGYVELSDPGLINKAIGVRYGFRCIDVR